MMPWENKGRISKIKCVNPDMLGSFLYQRMDIPNYVFGFEFVLWLGNNEEHCSHPLFHDSEGMRYFGQMGGNAM